MAVGNTIDHRCVNNWFPTLKTLSPPKPTHKPTTLPDLAQSNLFAVFSSRANNVNLALPESYRVPILSRLAYTAQTDVHSQGSHLNYKATDLCKMVLCKCFENPSTESENNYQAKAKPKLGGKISLKSTKSSKSPSHIPKTSTQTPIHPGILILGGMLTQ